METARWKIAIKTQALCACSITAVRPPGAGQTTGTSRVYSNGDGMAHYYASTASAVAFNFGTGTANPVDSQVIAFKASSGGGGVGPSISSLSPTSGAVGTTVTISGTNFGTSQGSSTVTFGGTPATTFSGWSATSIGVTVPTGANTGNVVVTVSGIASNGMSFTVISAPAITGLSPTSGAVGTTVTISGTNFERPGEQHGYLQRHAGNDIFGFSATSIGVTVPTGANTGNVVVTAGGQASNAISFTVGWPNGYSYRRTITIDHTKVPSTDQSNFPVLFSGTYSYLATTSNGGNVTSANGYDIIFTSDQRRRSSGLSREAYGDSSGLSGRVKASMRRIGRHMSMATPRLERPQTNRHSRQATTRGAIGHFRMSSDQQRNWKVPLDRNNKECGGHTGRTKRSPQIGDPTRATTELGRVRTGSRRSNRRWRRELGLISTRNRHS